MHISFGVCFVQKVTPDKESYFVFADKKQSKFELLNAKIKCISDNNICFEIHRL